MNRRVGPASPQRGFTLLELLVVFALIGLMLAIVPVAYQKLHESVTYTGLVRGLIEQNAAARLQAMSTGTPAALELDFENRRFAVPPETRGGDWPEDYRLEAVVARQEVTDSRTARIRYYPDGSSTGGSIRVMRPNGEGVRLRIDWLTGRITQEPLAIDD